MIEQILDWAKDPNSSNLIRTIAAFLAIPGAIWGIYLFSKWVRGKGIDSQLEEIKKGLLSRVEKENGTFVVFDRKEIDETIFALENKRYVSSIYDISLKEMVKNAIGKLTGIDYILLGDSTELLTLIEEYVLVELVYDKDGKLLGGKENTAIESLFQQARGDLVALNVLHEMLEPERRGVRYVFTNLGKAVVKSLLCIDDTNG